MKCSICGMRYVEVEVEVGVDVNMEAWYACGCVIFDIWMDRMGIMWM